MDEQNNIIKVGDKIGIVNGGNALPGCPQTWDEANKWMDEANGIPHEEVGNRCFDKPMWCFDCGFKLDYDGPILSVSSRFYPPKTHYGPTWDGKVSIYLFDEKVIEKKFDCGTLDDLKHNVESYVKDIGDLMYQVIKNKTTNERNTNKRGNQRKNHA